MKLARLSLERLPGIDRAFVLEELGRGLNLIVGPNGIGKSRLCTAVRALLWSERGVPGDRLTAEAEFEHEGVRWRVRRDGSLHVWQREGIDVPPPRLPGDRLDACFFLGLRDLLDDSDRAGQHLASEIRRQMSGGFDLLALERDFANGSSARIGQKEARALNSAESEIRQAERAQAEVERRELELGSLEARAAEADQAGQRLVHFDRAISLYALVRDHRQQQSELAAFPATLDRLEGREVERVERLEEELSKKREDREAAEQTRTESLAAGRATGLVEPVDSTVLASARERTEKLAELERALDDARVELARARAAVTATRRALGEPAESGRAGATDETAEDDPGEEMRVESDAALFGFLSESGQLARERGAVEEQLRVLAERHFSDEERHRLAASRRAVEPLRDWLGAPDPTGSELPHWPTGRFLLLAGLACAVLGLAGILLVRPGPVAIALLGLAAGLLAAGGLVRLRPGSAGQTDRRAFAIEKFPAEIDPPASWTREAVAEHLRRLEDQVSDLDSREKRSRDRGVERERLEQTLKSLGAREERLEARRRELAARFGIEPPRSDAELVDLARALDQARLARVDWRRAEARACALEALRREQLEAIHAVLKKLGVSPRIEEAPPVDAAAARAALRALEERDRRLRSALAEQAREEKDLERFEREIARLDAERLQIFRSVGLESSDRAELVQLAIQLEPYRERKRRCAELAHDIARDRSELEAVGEGALVETELARLTSDRVRLAERAGSRDEINKRLGEIRGSARAAREGHVLEDAIARRDALRRELRERREQALAAGAGRFLVDGVRREHESNQMPRVLERARERFGLFTHHRYELNVSPGEGESFVAIDATSGEGLAPDKLSDGTRAQLILAARLAFAEEAEAGADLPLFLDEAMDHSDPERFHAIARSLARMVADEGRQIFYLSNDPTDVERFEAAFAAEGCEALVKLDLAEIRGRGIRAEGPGALRVRPLPSVPSATGHTAESYGAAIGVTRFEPRRGASDQHVFHLLRDDLDVVEALVKARIETVGQCENLMKSRDVRADEIRALGEAALQLEARIDLLASFCDAWREGRGRRVGRPEIEASGAVTEKYLEGVVEVAAELAGDAGAVLAALRERSDPRLSGFRSNKADDLERSLSEQGCFDERPILDEAVLVDRALGTPAARQLSAKRAVELVHQWWSSSQRPAVSDEESD